MVILKPFDYFNVYLVRWTNHMLTTLSSFETPVSAGKLEGGKSDVAPVDVTILDSTA